MNRTDKAEISYLQTFYHDSKVGTLAKMRDGRIAFEYDDKWIDRGFSISPLSLPLKPGVFIPKMEPLDGLFGVFCDSLPDGWGRLLVDRFLLKHQKNPLETGPLYRLAMVSRSGMGALTYRPALEMDMPEPESEDLDRLTLACKQILETRMTSSMAEDFDRLYHLGGSSGGARPKIMTEIDGEGWIVKFPSSMDPPDIGKQEYDYSVCARDCGIEMMETRLFPSKLCSGYFGVKRFDRKDGKRIHTVSASGLLETSHRIPNLDYHILMQLTLAVTKDYEELKKLYRQMCFNVFAHNRDDHGKNFSYMYIESQGYRLTPAYDLTYSESLGGEHATCINGEGKSPQRSDLLAVASRAGISESWAKRTLKEIHEIVTDNLGCYITA